MYDLRIHFHTFLTPTEPLERTRVLRLQILQMDHIVDIHARHGLNRLDVALYLPDVLSVK